MKNIKKTIAVFLSVLMILSVVPIGAFAEKEFTPVISEAAQINYPNILPDGYSLTGKQNFDENGNAVFEIEKNDDSFSVSKWIYASGEEAADPDTPAAYPKTEIETPDPKGESYPSSYDARDYGLITPVEHQIGGTCWAHAAISCIETNYIKNGYGDTLDLSEYHTVWYSKNGYINGSTDSRNDGFVIKNLDYVLGTGGNTNDVGNAVLNFAGPVLESTFPMQSTNSASMLTEMTETFNFNNKYIYDTVVESIKSVNYDIESIKAAVLDYGAVWATYYSSGNYYNPSNYYNVKENQQICYYDPNVDDIDHAITIIGWDDNFSRDNFGLYKPQGDGAWLVKNSWGERWGNNGYFWISYEDKTLSRYNAEVFEVGDNSDYDNVYFYDGLGYRMARSAKAGANVFRAQDNEYLTKISYGATASRAYTLKIYKNLPENYTDPTQGTLAYTQSGNTNMNRYIDIEGDVKVNAGELFSVVLETSYVYFEGADYEAVEEIYTYTSNPGESFFKDSSGKWNDSSEYGYNNVCIRAVAKEIISNEAPYKVKFSDGGIYSEIIMTDGNTVVLPEKAGHTYVLSYNGEAYTGGETDRDITVSMHCYPTEGEKAEGEECKTVYKCIYCSKEMKEPVTEHIYPQEGTVSKDSVCVTEFCCEFCNIEMKEPVTAHNFSEVKTAATKNSIGYSDLTCTKCGFEYRDNYTIYDGAAGGLEGTMWWQYVDGILTVYCDGDTPDYTSASEAPWSAYADETGSVFVEGETLKLGNYLFSGLHSVTETVLPESVTQIGNYCFSGCASLKTFTCPSELLKIGQYSFSEASSLEDIIYNEKITDIGAYAYNKCNSLTDVVVPGTVRNTSSFIFNECTNLRSIVVEEGVKTVTYLTWQATKLEKLVIPSTATSVSNLNYVGLKEFVVSEDNTVYSSVDGVLYTKNGKTLVSYPATKEDKYFIVPETVESISRYAFSFTNNLVYLDMTQANVPSLAFKTFNQVKTIKNVNLPSSLAYIEEDAFFCTRINSIYIPASVSSLSSGSIFNRNGLSSYMIPSVYTDSENSAISDKAGAYGIECTTGHTAHDFAVTDLKINNDIEIKTCGCGQFAINDISCSGGHNMVSAEVVASTCTEDGYTKYICSVCGAEETGNIVKAEGHKFGWVTDTEPTCVSDGKKHQVCSVCGAEASLNTVISATGEHSFTDKVQNAQTIKTEATCNAYAVYYYSCSVCGAVEKNDSHTFSGTLLASHSYKWVTDKTSSCSEEGVKHEECSVCSAERNEGTAIEKLAHTQIVIPEVKATCSKTGLTEGIKCSVCDEVIKAQQVTEKASHSYVVTTTEATCTKDGVSAAVCSVCGDKTEKIFPATNHANKYGTKGLSPTCTENGYTGGMYCPDCKTYLSGHEVLYATNHAYKYTVSGSAPTCTNDGVTDGVYCPDCQKYLSGHKTIKATGHTEYVSKEAYAATCFEEGRTEETKCSVCEKVLKQSKAVSKTAHKDSDSDGLCDVCSADVSVHDRDKNCSCNCHKSGFMGFIWKIQNFFNKLFKTNKTCACGAAHY